jgi:hypothetical protein
MSEAMRGGLCEGFDAAGQITNAAQSPLRME